MANVSGVVKAEILGQIAKFGPATLEEWAISKSMSYPYLRLALREMETEGFIDLRFSNSKNQGFRNIQEIIVLA